MGGSVEEPCNIQRVRYPRRTSSAACYPRKALQGWLVSIRSTLILTLHVTWMCLTMNSSGMWHFLFLYEVSGRIHSRGPLTSSVPAVAQQLELPGGIPSFPRRRRPRRISVHELQGFFHSPRHHLMLNLKSCLV